jgi:hypothetical protein
MFFFHWIERQFESGKVSRRPRAFTRPLKYARERGQGLEVFLTDPAVPMLPTMWSALCTPFRWEVNNGTSVGGNSAPKTLVLHGV